MQKQGQFQDVLDGVKVLLLITSSVGLANPNGGQVTAGSAQIMQSTPQRLDIVQHTDRAAINWQSFNINRNEHVNFRQPSAQSSTLNRVVGQDPSNILGRLTSNGKVFLLNPNGILFGKNSKIDVGGLVATTSNMKDADFMAGRFNFDNPTNSTGRIVNQGAINAKTNGLVALVAPGVSNTGIINAKLGRVTLASGRKFTLDLYGDQLVKLAVDDNVVTQVIDSKGNPVNAQVNQSGEINAEGGQVMLAASTARLAVDNVINMNGIIRARSATQHKGEIILDAGEGAAQVSGVLDASGQHPGQSGGSVKVLGNNVRLERGATINASGANGGGTVLVGGDFQGKGTMPNAYKTVISQGATVKADAVSQGNGGKVVVWADGETQYHGHISAKGGSQAGDGGFAEVSGKKNLVYRGDTTLTSPHGKAGTLLLDPENITVSADGSDSLSGDPSTIKANTISKTLGKGTSVKLLANNNIDVNATIDSRYRGAPSGAGIALNAGNNIHIKADILTKNGAITAAAKNGGITMDEGKVLFAGNKAITLTAGKDIQAQHLVTSGDSALSSRQGSVNLGQDLGGAPGFQLAKLNINADQGAVTMKGLQATNDIQVTAQKNIDFNRPILSTGGAITLTSQGSNVEQTGNDININADILAKDGIISATASNGSVKMADKTQLFSGNKAISITAGRDIQAQHLVTSGDVVLSSKQGSVNLGQDLGGATGFQLAKLNINADQGAVKMNGLQTTSDIQVTAQKNIDVNGPVQSSGGAITLTSRGSNVDRTAINLNHNLYTNGKDITLDGDVLLNPTAEELIAKLKEKEGDAGALSNSECSVTLCNPKLCPECDIIIRDNPDTADVVEKFVVVDTNIKRFRFTDRQQIDFDFKDESGKTIVHSYKSTDGLPEADRRVDEISKLFDLHQVTIDSKGGNIVFKGNVDRYTGVGAENFKKATVPVIEDDNDPPDQKDQNRNGVVDALEATVFDSFKHHGLTLSAGDKGNITFEKDVGNQPILASSIDSRNNLLTQKSDRGVLAVGSFQLSILNSQKVKFNNNLFLNDLFFKDIPVRQTGTGTFDAPSLEFLNADAVNITPFNFDFNPGTVYTESIGAANKIDPSKLNGINLDPFSISHPRLPLLPTPNIAQQAQVPQRNVTCKKTVSPEKEVLSKSTQDSKIKPSSQQQLAKQIAKALGEENSSADCNG